MLTWIAVASGAWAVWLVVRWRRAGPGPFGRPAPKPWVSVGLLAAMSAVGATLVLRDRALEQRLSRVASSLAGRPVHVECQSWAGAFLDANVESGYVRFDAGGQPDSSTTLKADICRSLTRYLRSPTGRPSEAEVVAVHILTHEAMHMEGIRNEAAADCAAVQRDAATARMLGADAEAAAALVRRYWVEVYPRLGGDYRSADCGPGGRLDEALPDAPWAPGPNGAAAE